MDDCGGAKDIGAFTNKYTTQAKKNKKINILHLFYYLFFFFRKLQKKHWEGLFAISLVH